MSLRIKVPPKVTDDARDTPQSSSSEHQHRRRLVNKRRIAIDSDEEGEEDEDDTHGNDQSLAHLSTSPVDILSNDFALSSPPLIRLPTEAPPSVPVKKGKSRTIEEKSRPTKKRKPVVNSDSDDDFAVAAMHDDMDNWEPEEKVKKGVRKGKGKAASAAATGKGKTQAKSGPSTKRESSPPTTGAKRGRAKAAPATTNTGGGETGTSQDISMDASTMVEDPTPMPSSVAPPPPKKKKLPPIKKIKALPGSAASTAVATTPTATPSTATPANSVLPGLGKETKGASRLIPSQVGNADLNLLNASVYNDLFGAGGNASRSVMSRREKEEERRKELNKMREEAKAKRLADTTPPFDLQRQADKIARFDEVLRSRRTTALWPNFLAAKWRDMDKERDRQKEKDSGWQQNTQSQGNT